MAEQGRSVLLPLFNRPIPLILDAWADPALGTGCVKITPAHDPNDYDVWSRHCDRIGLLNILNPDGEARRLASKVTMNIRRGDVLRHELAGPGGWGDPLDRDPDAVMRDVRNEIVSRERAEACYGVVIAPTGWTVDTTATLTLRARLRTQRGWDETPFVSRTPSHPGADRRQK